MRGLTDQNNDDGLYRVLIVDDNPGDADLTLERLSEAHSTAIASSIASTLGEAIEMLRTLLFDIVILDLNLPDSRGFETFQTLQEKSASAVPVVIVSGMVNRELREQGLREGAHEVISKDELRHRWFAMSVMYVIERNRARVRGRQMEKLLNTTPDAVVVLSMQGKVQYINASASRIFGWNPTESLNRSFPFQVERNKTSEVKIPQNNKNDLFGEMRVVEFVWQGEPSLLIDIRDITEQKNMEMQLLLSDRMVSIGTLAAGVAHEINNPLASLIGNLSMVSEKLPQLEPAGPLISQIREEIQDAQEAAERVQTIVRDLKVFSRPEDETVGPVDAFSVMDSTLRMARNEIRHRATIVKHYKDVPTVQANKSRLSQVLLNLLVNAAQALPADRYSENKIHIAIGKDERGHAVIQITDNGMGMPPHVQRRIFTPFFTTKPEGKGTGLGLAISHRIIASLNGTISFQSQEGKGTTFTIVLPPSNEALPMHQKRGNTPVSSLLLPTTTAHILVVDDEDIIIRLFQRALGRNHNVLGLTDANTALQRLLEGDTFDIIFCDLMMPTMTGMTFYEEVSKLGKGQEKDIVFMTGGAFTEEARTFLAHVSNSLLGKPFDITELRSLVEDTVTSSKR